MARTDADEATRNALGQSTRFSMPYPIACLYRLRRSRHEASAQVAWSYRLAEGIARFLALVALADVLPRVSVGDRRQLLKPLQQPGFGKLLWVLREAQRHGGNSGVFLREVASLSASWWSAISELNEQRNRFAHDELHIPEEQALALLPEVTSRIDELIHGIGFLRDYRLGYFTGGKKSVSGVRAQWYCARGLEETEPPVEIRMGDMPFDGMMTLIDVRDGRALGLEPFFVFAPCDHGAGHHLLWLQRQEPTRGLWVYRHASEPWEAARKLAAPGEPDGVSDDTYLEEAQRWPSVLQLGLTPQSLEALRDRTKPTFDERYRVGGALGTGGMGTVWEAFDTTLSRRCALKVIHPHLMTSVDARRRMKREAQALARLNHPGIVRVYDTDRTSEGSDVLVMELCEGESLEERLRRGKPLPPEEAVRIVSQLLDALAHAHKNGIIHRDIKPANVILTDEVPRLIDFGLANIQDLSRMTRTAQPMGTFGYIAPEYVNGEEPTPAVDVYAIGKVWLVMLLGRMPAAGEVESAIAMAAVEHRDALRRMVAQDRPQRFADAGTAIARLNATKLKAPTDPESSNKNPDEQSHDRQRRSSEQARRSDDWQVAEDLRRRAETKRRAEAQKAERVRSAEEARRADEERRGEQARRSDDWQVAEDLRRRAETERMTEAQKAEEVRKAEETRRAHEARRAEQARRSDDWQVAEDLRRHAETKRRAEAQKAEEARKKEEVPQAEAARNADEATREEQGRNAADARRAESAAKLREADNVVFLQEVRRTRVARGLAAVISGLAALFCGVFSFAAAGSLFSMAQSTGEWFRGLPFSVGMFGLAWMLGSLTWRWMRGLSAVE